MKKFIPLFALLLPMSAAFGMENGPQNTAPRPSASLYAIRANATEASENAAIYQWMRVNREVDRVVAAERKVETALQGEASSTAALQSLQEAVRALRSARLAHDVKRIQEAARQVVAGCDALLK